MRFVLDPPLTPQLRDQIVDLWLAVSEAGGAVGFVPPVTRAEVAATADAAFTRADDRFLVGFDGDHLVAMLIFVYGFKLNAHWRTVKRVMVHPGAQGKGYGAQLMREAERVARARGWEDLYLTVRSGRGVEHFYEALGYKEVGRLPGALRVAPGDDRDEILMWLTLS